MCLCVCVSGGGWWSPSFSFIPPSPLHILPLPHFSPFPLSFLLSTHKLTHRLLSAIPLLIRELRSLPDSNNLSIAFPDEGAHKRFHSGLQQWPSITCIKVREGDKRIVNIKDGEMREREERKGERRGEG